VNPPLERGHQTATGITTTTSTKTSPKKNNLLTLAVTEVAGRRHPTAVLLLTSQTRARLTEEGVASRVMTRFLTVTQDQPLRLKMIPKTVHMPLITNMEAPISIQDLLRPLHPPDLQVGSPVP
jgi:hypothetical protein